MDDFIKKYTEWDDNEKSPLIYMGYIIAVIGLSLFVYFKIKGIEGIESFGNMMDVYSSLSSLRWILQLLRFLAYGSVVYFAFDFFANRQNVKNVAKLLTLVGSAFFMIAIFILNPVISLIIKMLSATGLDSLLGGFGDFESLSKIAPDWLLAYLFLAFAFLIGALVIFIKGRMSGDILMIQSTYQKVEEGTPAAINVPNVNIDKKVLTKVGAVLAVGVVIFFGYNYWDKNFNLKKVNTQEIFEVSFEGIDGEGSVILRNVFPGYDYEVSELDSKKLDSIVKQDAYVYNLYGDFDKSSNLANGDTIILTVTAKSDEAKKLGLKLSDYEIEYTVSGLSIVPKTATDIKDLREVVAFAGDNFNFESIMPDKEGKVSLHSVYFRNKEIYEEQTGSIAGFSNKGTHLAFVYKVTGKRTYYFSSNDEDVEYYYIYQVDNLTIDENGNLDESVRESMRDSRYSSQLSSRQIEAGIETSMKSDYGMIKVEW